MSVTVLKKGHSLVGLSHYRVVKELRQFNGTLPVNLARLKAGHPLDSYQPAELVQHVEGLLGCPAVEILDMAGIQGAECPEGVEKSTLLFFLHITILEANARGQPKGVQLKEPELTDKGESKRPAASHKETEEPAIKVLILLL